MTFLDSLHDDDDDTLFLWMPIAIQIGILLAVSLRECAAVVWRQTHGLLLFFRERLRLLLDGDDVQMPMHENNLAVHYTQYNSSQMASRATNI